MSSGNATLDRFRFQRMLERLEELEGRGTELVTVYIPPGKQIHDVMTDLRNEYGTAVNIKSKTTRKNVQDALTKAMERLKLFNKVPETGLAIFAGTIASDQLGVGDMQTFTLIPPEPIGIYYYRCEHRFMLEPLWEILEHEDSYGILVIDAKDATFALLKGQRADILKDMSSGVAGKTRAGGQSSRRYERLRQMHLQEYFNRVGDHMTDLFLNLPNLKGIIVGGPGPTKEEFIKGNYLHHEIREKIMTTVDTGYTGHEGVKELVTRSRSFLEQVRYTQERKIVQEFLKHLGEDDGLGTYGEDEVITQLKNMNVYTLLLSASIRRWQVTLQCRTCEFQETRIVDMDDYEEFVNNLSDLNCLKCSGGNYEIVEREDLIEVLVKMAEDAEARLEVISTHTEEGEMLLRSFGGIAAITKYRTY
ncbi:MAG: peptide chain release factor aRF-1 [Candidatus Bathyarchaeota archaeon]|nr:peptide chain release factor aRF-1 [Candidatus Bathyarchaeota archaeon]